MAEKLEPLKRTRNLILEDDVLVTIQDPDLFGQTWDEDSPCPPLFPAVLFEYRRRDGRIFSCSVPMEEHDGPSDLRRPRVRRPRGSR